MHVVHVYVLFLTYKSVATLISLSYMIWVDIELKFHLWSMSGPKGSNFDMFIYFTSKVQDSGAAFCDGLNCEVTFCVH